MKLIPLIVIWILLILAGPASQARTVKASYYNAKHRSSFASRHKEWQGKTFALTYRGRTVHAVCRGYGPQAWTGRHIDVSRDVAQRLGFIKKGVATLHIKRVK